MNVSTMKDGKRRKTLSKVAIVGRKSSFIFKAGFSGSAFVDQPWGMIYRLAKKASFAGPDP
jgi:hypothetical protein